jgi:cyanophycin synthetase
VDAPLPFAESRRLLGANLFFAGPAAVLETVGIDVDAALLAGWRARVARACAAFGWSESRAVARPHRRGASLAISADWDRLFTATEVNEWALCATLAERTPALAATLPAAMFAELAEDADDPATIDPPVLEESAALARLARLAGREARPALRTLLDAARARGLPVVLDDSALTLGLGARSRTYALDALPAPSEVESSALGSLPVALVTGSNGKTTTVRLVAACLRAQGLTTGYTCTDGIWVDDAGLAAGDWSGPDGARRVLRDARVQAAVLETARGGILRRGVAAPPAGAAVVTNVSSDHFGEYGIDDLDALADAKLSIAGALAADGRLVLNAEDALLRAKSTGLATRFARPFEIAWFAQDADAPALAAHRAGGGATCGVRGGHLWLERGASQHDVGALAAMPLAIGGAATFNVANLAAAALAADTLGVPPETIARTYAAFGAAPRDNAGRLMRYELNGVRVLVDYAHNPAALRAVLGVARSLVAPGGRLGMLLGHAGNRRDEDMAAVARVAAEFRPDLVVVKENEAHLRGRAPGEVPALLRAALLAAGLPESALPVAASELEAAQKALEWARPGDVVALLVHASAARAAVLERLEADADRSR